LEPLRRTLATTPLPRRTKNIVPMISAKKISMLTFLFPLKNSIYSKEEYIDSNTKKLKSKIYV
jgi:hypothetical protein